MTEKFTAEIQVDTNVPAAAKQMEASINNAAAAFARLDAAINKSQKTANSFKLGSTGNSISGGLGVNQGNLSALQAQKKAQDAAFSSYAQNVKIATDADKQFAAQQKQNSATIAANAKAEAAAIRGIAQERAAYRKGIAAEASAVAKAESLKQKQINQSSTAQVAYFNQARANGIAYGQDVTASMQSTRYALYDVARTWTVVSTATLGAVAAIETVGIAFEKSFTAVERTTGATGDRLGELRDNLVQMSTSMPTSFGEITQIASLGGQLGIEEDGIEAFTETVAQMAATTNLSMDSAGTALGRFKALLGVSESEFSNLGSSILKVGVNSVATETAIVDTANQISSFSNLAGLTADQTVGLAGALASVQVPPELSRGTIVRTFSLMGDAVSKGGESLDLFASTAGVSAQEFKSAWGTDQFAGVLQGFLRGLGTQGDRANDTLRELGINSTRDRPALLKLAQAGDVVSQSFADAASGYEENSELSRQYGLVSDDAASKLVMLVNTIKAIADAASELGILKSGLDLLQGLTEAALAFVQTPLGKGLATVSLALGTVVGLFAAYQAALMLTRGAAAGMVVAQSALAGSSMKNALSITALIKGMLGLAVGTDRAAAAQTRLTAIQNASGFGKITAGAAGAGAAIKNAGVATAGLVRSFAPLAVAAGVIWAITESWSAYSDSQKTALDRSREFYGDLSGLMAAVKQDSSAEYTGEVFRTISIEADRSRVAIKNRSAALSTAAGVEKDSASTTRDTTDAITDQTIKIGENALAWITNSVVANEGIQELWQRSGKAISATGFELEEYLRLLASDTPAEASAYLQGYRDDVTALQDTYRNSNGELKNLTDSQMAQYVALGAQQGGLRELDEQLGGTGGLFDELASVIDLSRSAGATATDGYAEMSEGLGEIEDESQDAVKALKELMDAVMGPEQAVYALADSLSSLGESLYDNGTGFDMFTESGRANMDALQGAISAATTASGGDSAVLAQNLKGIMDSLLAYGVDVAAEIPSLMALYNEAAAAADNVGRLTGAMSLVPGMGAISKAVGLASGTVGSLGKASIDTGKAMRGGFAAGATKAAKAADKASKSSKDTAKEIRTLADYVSDLGSVFKSTFDYQFGLEQAVDEVSDSYAALVQLKTDAEEAVADATENYKSAIENIRTASEGLEDARQDVSDLNIDLQELAATLMGLRSTRGILEYQLGVAIEYGDTLRQNELMAELAENSAEISAAENDRVKTSRDLNRQHGKVTDAEKELSEAHSDVATSAQAVWSAQADMTRSLDGTSESSKDQRAAVLSLVTSYQSQVQQLASSGLSTDQLARKTAELKTQFQQQLTQLGYNNTEIARYSTQFDNLVTAIGKVPRDLTVNVSGSTSAVDRALSDFMERNSNGKGASAGVDIPVRAGGVDDSGLKKAARAANILAQIDVARLNSSLNPMMAPHFAAIILALTNQLNSGNYAQGGYTGAGGKYEPAGVVHKGEYVVPKHMVNQSTGLPYANAMGQILNGYAGGGFVRPAPTVVQNGGGMVELSPTDRALLAAAGNVTLMLDGRVVASSVNNNNTRNSNRG